MARLVIIIPAYNEEKNIGRVIRDIPDDLPIKREIVVIDDGSGDNTRESAKSAGAHVISFASNRGLVAAFNKGVEYALSREADIIVNIDGDGQHNPSEMMKLIQPILDNKADIVIGSRFIGDYKHPSFIKHIGNIAFSFTISKLLGQKITDAQSGFRAFTREVAEKIDIKKGYTYTQQMIVQAEYHNFKILEVPIEARERAYGKSKLMKNPFSFAYNAWRILLTIFAIYYPLKFFSFFGVLLMLGGLGTGLFFPEKNVLSSLIISTGIQLILFGVLFEIIRKK